MDIEKEQKRFERWFLSKYTYIYLDGERFKIDSYSLTDLFRKDGCEYSIQSVNDRWAAWQAAKQDGMTEERARKILEEEFGGDADNCHIVGFQCSIEVMKAYIYWVERK